MSLRSNILRVVLLLLTVVSVVEVTSLRPVSGDAEQPAYAIGDHWTYSVTSYGNALHTLPGTGVDLWAPLLYNLTVIDAETLTVNGTSYPVYREGLSGVPMAGSFPKTNVLARFSLVRQSDLADLQDHSSLLIQSIEWLTTTSNYDPASQSLQFPLYVGKTWSQTYDSQTNYTIMRFPFPTTSGQYLNTTATSHAVISRQLTTVPAGTFDTYLVRSNNTSGTTDTYYSPEVKQIVQENSYDNTGAFIAAIKLQSFDAWEYSTDFQAHSLGKNYAITVNTDVPAINIAQNPTSITFRVSGNDTVTGRANVTIPIRFNSTALSVSVDGAGIGPESILEDSSNYYIFFTFPLSTHTISISYGSSNVGLPAPLIFGIVAVVAAVVGVILVLVWLGPRSFRQLSKTADSNGSKGEKSKSV